MALTYDQISGITQKKFIPKLYDNIFDSNPLLQRAKKKFYEKIDGGERIVVPLNYAQVTSSGWYSGSETLQTTDNEIITAAEYTWKQLYANISINRIDELKNSGDSQIISLVKNKTKTAEKTMEDKLGTGLYSAGSDSKSIVGLRDIVATDQTVGGISQSSYSWWQAQVDSSTTTLTIGAMQAVDNDCTVNNDMPTVIMTTRTLYNSYYALLQPQQRFMDSETAKGGFSSLMFNGKPVIADSYCPSSHMFFLNENYLHLFVHKDEDMRFEPFQKPVNQNVKVAKIFWAGAFGSSNNRLHGALTAATS
jgi:hypothetical protein